MISDACDRIVLSHMGGRWKNKQERKTFQLRRPFQNKHGNKHDGMSGKTESNEQQPMEEHKKEEVKY